MTTGAGRAFRGLLFVFLLSFFNLVGLIVTAIALGGLAPWSRWQFIGAFGIFEAASGLVNIISPNVWRLPVAELTTSGRTDVKLAGSTLLLPHWGGLARSAAGLVCIAAAVWQEGLGVASAGLVPFVVALAWSMLASRGYCERTRRDRQEAQHSGAERTNSSALSRDSLPTPGPRATYEAPARELETRRRVGSNRP